MASPATEQGFAGSPIECWVAQRSGGRGADTWARSAVTFGHLARHTVPALIDGAVGLVLAPGGKLRRVLIVRIVNGRVAEIDIIGDPDRLHAMDIGALD